MKIAATLFLANALALTAAFVPNANNNAAKSKASQLNIVTTSDMFDIATGRPVMGYRSGYYYPGGPTDRSNSNGMYGDNKIEGGSRRTFDTTYTDRAQVQLETDGRPLDAKVEIWEGPDNTPAKMKLWSEDGRERPWGPVGFGNFNQGGYTYYGRGSNSIGSSMTVDNDGSTEFPIYATVGMGGRGAPMGTSRRQTIRVEGNGAQRSFNIQGPCVIEIWSEGFPYYANVEVWDGPNNIKQSAEVYADNGMDRPWSAVIDSPLGQGTIQIRNPGPLEYPLLVSIEPLGGGGGGYGGYRGGYGGGYGGY